MLRGGCGLFWTLWCDRELCDLEAAANWLATEKGSCKSHVIGKMYHVVRLWGFLEGQQTKHATH